MPTCCCTWSTAASPVLDEQMAEVQRVLAEIGAADIPQVLVFNKLDRLEDSQRPRVLRDAIELAAGVRVPRVFISAQSGEGMAELRAILAEAVAGDARAPLEARRINPRCQLVGRRVCRRHDRASCPKTHRRPTPTFHPHDHEPHHPCIAGQRIAPARAAPVRRAPWRRA